MALILHDSSEVRAPFLWSHLQFLPAPLKVIHLGLNSFRATLYCHYTYLRFQFPLNHVCPAFSSVKVIRLDREHRRKMGRLSRSSVNITHLPQTCHSASFQLLASKRTSISVLGAWGGKVSNNFCKLHLILGFTYSDTVLCTSVPLPGVPGYLTIFPSFVQRL